VRAAATSTWLFLPSGPSAHCREDILDLTRYCFPVQLLGHFQIAIVTRVGTHSGDKIRSPETAPMILVKKSYVICTTPRSGSHLLAYGLNDTGVAGYPDERFPPLSQRPPISLDNVEWLTSNIGASYDAEGDRQYVGKVIESSTSENGVFGVTLHWHQLDDAVRRIRSYFNTASLLPNAALRAAFPNLSYIWLRRCDVVAQAVSWYRAICTDTYITFRGDSEGADTTQQIPFDFDKIQLLVSILKCADAAWRRFFNEHSIRPYVITYESLHHSYESTIRTTLRHLEVDSGAISIGSPRVRKMAGATSSQWVQRYKVLAEL
jgi:LPS sulfotransferase NodH